MPSIVVSTVFVDGRHPELQGTAGVPFTDMDKR